tara:strand:- start:56682 stop:57725 length:1044 start_codon:yes stop_codon:yes gene_type:complete
MATNDFLRTKNKAGQPITQGQNISAEILFQTNGKRDWHQLYHFPKFGFGIQYLWFPQTDEIGSPVATYALFEGPIHRWKNAQLDWGFHFGVALGWNPQNMETNPYNVLLGSTSSLYAHLGIIYQHNLTKRLGMEASLGFSHGSNGALKMPNFGINLFDPRLAFTYQLNPEKPILQPHELAKFSPSNELSLSYAIGTKQIDVSASDSTNKARFGDMSFTIYNFALVYQRQISRRSKIGAGVDFTMDPSDNAHGLVVGDTNSSFPPSFSEKAKLALILSYELSIGKLSLVLQPGFYFYRTTHDPTPFFYQRIGTRYNIYKGFYLGASLRAVNFGQADWIELTAGYKIKF